MAPQKYTIEERRQKNRESCKKYREQHPEKVRERQHKWYIRTKNADLEGWRKKQREKARRHHDSGKKREWQRKRMEYILAGNVTRLELIDLFEKSDERCHYCGVHIERPRFDPHLPVGFDHVIPFCKGGKHEISNMVVCCGVCNRKKGMNSSLIEK